MRYYSKLVNSSTKKQLVNEQQNLIIFLNQCMAVSQQHGRAELSADYCVSNTATRVRLRLQAACFDTYAGS